VVDPPGECHSDFEFVFELAKKLGLGEYFPWNTVEEAFEDELKPTGFTLRDLKERPAGISIPLEDQKVYRKHVEQGFATPTKKIELFSTTFEEHGYNPLPDFEEPEESPISRNDIAKDYPLICSAAIKPILYTHNQFRTVAWLREIMPDSWIEIHPRRANDLGIRDGDLVEVESLRGSIKVKAKLSEDISPNTVYLPHGWGEPYAHGPVDNDITPDSLRCPVSASTSNRAFLCNVKKA
jgi:anaerobic selenocysteine-containing dehydrogenase